jgi:hypothetical protein
MVKTSLQPILERMCFSANIGLIVLRNGIVATAFERTRVIDQDRRSHQQLESDPVRVLRLLKKRTKRVSAQLVLQQGFGHQLDRKLCFRNRDNHPELVEG